MTVTGTVYTRSGVTGIAVQKVIEASTAKSAAKYVCPMDCIPPQEKPGNCPKCRMKLVVKK
ncbi:MAG: heavy metal-binding domain-containing protein [Candidatus Fervidibacter sp.]|uniref:heavy metal-binding domain-containing protein n=1 Tax=Candidatus Fervidibacter sp. TaxID=3100871 RepID=UPI004049E32B